MSDIALSTEHPVFPTTDLSQNTKNVLDAALREPVVLTHYRKPRYAIMAYEDFERLTGGSVAERPNPQRAYELSELPQGELGAFVDAIDEDLST